MILGRGVKCVKDSLRTYYKKASCNNNFTEGHNEEQKLTTLLLLSVLHSVRPTKCVIEIQMHVHTYTPL